MKATSPKIIDAAPGFSLSEQHVVSDSDTNSELSSPPESIVDGHEDSDCLELSQIAGEKSTSSKGKLHTRVHGKWYELSKFDHPGGPVALDLAKGRDATALFESHHYFIPRKQLLQILAKYEVPAEEAKHLHTMNDKLEDDNPYEWEGIENDGFANEIRQLAVDYFTDLAKKRGISVLEAAKATPQRNFISASLLVAFFASLPAFVQGQWAFLFITPVLCWLAICNYWHDALHFSLSTNWRINAYTPYVLPFLSSPWLWYHQHCVGHHVYTNVPHKDPDLAHFAPFMREHQSIRWRPAHAYQALWWNYSLMWSVATGVGLNLRNAIRAIVKMNFNNVVPCQKPNMLGMASLIGGRVLYVYVAYVWPFQVFSSGKAALWALVANAVFSVCFMVNTQINHLVGPCSHTTSTNFYKSQVLTAQDFGHDSTFCFYFSGGLNYQIEHHLFPCINHCHLPALAPGVKRICKKYDVPYNYASGYRAAIKDHFEHKGEMAEKPKKQ
mmetsp:Transcript_28700/g.60600  ORF Transcript_28700/g.60600 Transcript_28700/m.60600 type:complete len:498 (-) Transcript_28700:59-1552(-)